MGEVLISRENSEDEEFEETSFAGFTLKKEIGKGGQGTIFEAKKKGSDETIALKISNKATKKSKKQFGQETAALTELNGDHQGIVKIIETGICKKKPFIALELVNGENLENILNKYSQIQLGSHKQFMPVDYVLNIMSQLADALDFAHGKNVVHGDLKPANILVTRDDKIKITDFGLSKLSSANLKNSLSLSGEITGTIQYMSPERQAGSELCTGDDIYSLGTILYKALTNRLPLEDRFKFNPSEINKEVPKEVDSIFKKCISQVKDRYQNTKQLIKDLKNIQNEINELKKENKSGRVIYETSIHDIANAIKKLGYIPQPIGYKIIRIVKKGKETVNKGLFFSSYKSNNLFIGELYLNEEFPNTGSICNLQILGRQFIQELKSMSEKISAQYYLSIKLELNQEYPVSQDEMSSYTLKMPK